MQPREATVTIHVTRMVPYEMSVDGNSPMYETVHKIERVNAMVWPVSMGADEMLVEYEDGTLGTAHLSDIRLVNRA